MDSKIIKHPFLEWRNLDADNGMVMPWYTAPCLEWLKTIDVSNWRVFEYGSGMSTWWWRFNAKHVRSVDTSEEWANKTGANFSTIKEAYVDAPYNIVVFGKGKTHLLFDVIIIDGSWRDECTRMALKAIKLGGYIIIDNYHQASVDLPEKEWRRTDELLKKYPEVIFHQEGHPDWKTGIWQIV